MENGIPSCLRRRSIGLCLALVPVLIPANVAFARMRVERAVKHVPGELVVKVRGSGSGIRLQTAEAISALARTLGDRSVVGVRALKTDAAIHVVRLARDADMASAIETLKKVPAVEIAEPNLFFHAYDDGEPVRGLPNDPDLDKTWGLRNTGQADAAGQVGMAGSDIHVVPLWQEGFIGSLKTLVAVIDTGIDWEHADLKANLYTNPGEAGDLGANGQDDDGNGFVDDLHGWNFDRHSNNSSDDHDHGTHCSGTIGGVGNNGIGVTGVNWNVSLMPVKFLDASGGGTLEGAVESINYATMMKVNIMSNSWGGGGYSETLKLAIEKARDAGILFVAAAGNDGGNNDASPQYPASYEISNVLSVAATDNRDEIASFSNFGTRTVHVAAPGVKVYSTVKGGKYNTFSGTSMATPHVSGIAALLLSANPDMTFAELKERLIKTSDPVVGLKRKVASKGRVNAYNALHNIVPITNEPDPSLWKTEDLVIESEHPYQASTDQLFEIHRPGAKFIRIHFEKVEVEANYDKVFVQTSTGAPMDELTGSMTDYVSEHVTGDKAVIRFKSDSSVNGYGFKVDKIQVIY